MSGAKRARATCQEGLVGLTRAGRKPGQPVPGTARCRHKIERENGRCASVRAVLRQAAGGTGFDPLQFPPGSRNVYSVACFVLSRVTKFTGWHAHVHGVRSHRHREGGHLIYFATGLVLVVGALWLFNRLVRRRNQVRNAWSDVDVQLQRRHDLVPMLVESVRGYASHEQQLLRSIATERSAALRASSVVQRMGPEVALGQHLDRLIALGEAYPALKASGNFIQLSTQLVEIEDGLQHARRFYNGSVREYNTALETFPAVLFARTFAFKPAEYFAAAADARCPVGVDLGEAA